MRRALKVVAPGLHTTVQDLGRYGYQAAGVPVSGALDAECFRLANRLVGNPDNTAALEILYQGPTLEVAADRVLVGLAGGDAEIERLGDRRRVLGGWRSVELRRGDRFRIGRLGTAACCYLAVAGGIAVEPCLGSASTFVRGGFGGFAGRALREGDLLPLAEDAEAMAELRLKSPPDPGLDRIIRIVLGPQQDHFTEGAIETLLGAEFAVSKSADRMGLRLDGPRLQHRDGYNIVSDGIATGAIQVPGSGQPILLLADHQTTGGYPKIATVVSADLPVVGRRRPGDRIRFRAVEVAEAEQLRRDSEAALAALTAAMSAAAAAEEIDHDLLHQLNLISGVVAGDE
ncbi:MAG TPA: biotin-dependent carboxyltransferase family protein [Stellaceae bacterium]|nr:biotin-dependent carboxyltransferase family protein [Stellaceae bacterium]